MSVQCQQCGSVQPSGKFCPNCGGQMVPAVPQPPAAAQMMPQPQPYPPKAPSRTPWGLIAGIGGGVLVIGIAAAVFLLMKDPKPTPNTPPPANVVQNDPTKPEPAKTDPAKTEPAKPAAPAGPSKSVGGTALKLLGQGSFGTRPSTMVAHGSYLGVGTQNAAAFYKFDASGKPKELAKLQTQPSVGELLSVAVGDLYNNGQPHMLALYETKLYIIAEQGGILKEIDVEGVDKVFIGDYDGDGKNETIYMSYDGDAGTYGFEVWRYPDNSGAQYRKAGRQDPWPALFQTEMKAGKTSLLMGFEFVGNDLSLLLYKWDGIGGPAVIGSYPVENKTDAPAEWIASGPSGFGPTLAVSRSGGKPSVEVLTVSSDAKSAKSVGRFESDGPGYSAVLTGNFTGKGSQILTVDEAGGYRLYDIAK